LFQRALQPATTFKELGEPAVFTQPQTPLPAARAPRNFARQVDHFGAGQAAEFLLTEMDHVPMRAGVEDQSLVGQAATRGSAKA